MKIESHPSWGSGIKCIIESNIIVPANNNGLLSKNAPPKNVVLRGVDLITNPHDVRA